MSNVIIIDGSLLYEFLLSQTVDVEIDTIPFNLELFRFANHMLYSYNRNYLQCYTKYIIDYNHRLDIDADDNERSARIQYVLEQFIQQLKQFYIRYSIGYEYKPERFINEKNIIYIKRRTN